MSQRAVCERVIAALERADFAAIGAMLEPDFAVHEAAGLPYAGTYRGIDGWRALSRAVVKTWVDFKFAPLEIFACSPDAVVVRFAIAGRSRKTGKAFDTTVLELWRFRNERLREIVPYYWDTFELATIDRA